jgi:hypothetical protein
VLAHEFEVLLRAADRVREIAHRVDDRHVVVLGPPRKHEAEILELLLVVTRVADVLRSRLVTRQPSAFERLLGACESLVVVLAGVHVRRVDGATDHRTVTLERVGRQIGLRVVFLVHGHLPETLMRAVYSSGYCSRPSTGRSSGRPTRRGISSPSPSTFASVSEMLAPFAILSDTWSTLPFGVGAVGTLAFSALAYSSMFTSPYGLWSMSGTSVSGRQSQV